MILSWIILICASLICYTGFAFRRGRHLDWLEIMTNEEISREVEVAESIGFKLLIVGFGVITIGTWTYFYGDTGVLPIAMLIFVLLLGGLWILMSLKGKR